jgi:histidinol-phosphatase (PHP family)
MPISLHSHSGSYCLHASGTLEQVVDQAIEKGFKVYGLSEHMPRTRKEDLYPEEVRSILHPILKPFLESHQVTFYNAPF